MKENSPLADLCPEKKLTNHSARQTLVKKLKSSGLSKSEIKSKTSLVHTDRQNKAGLTTMIPVIKKQQHAISTIIDLSTTSPRSVSSKV